MNRRIIQKKEAFFLALSSMIVVAGGGLSFSLRETEKIFGINFAGNDFSSLTLIAFTFLVLVSFLLIGACVDYFKQKLFLVFGLFLFIGAQILGWFFSEGEPLFLSKLMTVYASTFVLTTTTSLFCDKYKGVIRNQWIGWQAASICIGLFLFFLSKRWQQTYTWIIPFGSSFFAFFLLCLHAKRRKNLFLRRKIVPTEEKEKRRNFLLIYLIAFIGMVAFSFIPLELRTLLTKKLHITSSKVWVSVVFALSFAVISSFMYKELCYYFSYLTSYGTLFLLMGIGFFILAIAKRMSQIILGMIFLGLGVGLLFPTSVVWLTNSVSEKNIGKAVAFLYASLFLGQFFSPLIYNYFLSLYGWQEHATAFHAACIFTLTLSIGFLFLEIFGRLRAFQVERETLK